MNTIMSAKKKKIKEFKADDIRMSGNYPSSYLLFDILTLTENILDDDSMWDLTCFLEENGIQCDQLNMEYMGHLTGQVKKGVTEEMLVTCINDYLSQYL
jgi:hypothetical protein